MNVILFGAGASAFSGECRPSNPPLGAQLYETLLLRGGTASEIDPSIGAVLRRDFEAGMLELRTKDDLKTLPFLRQMGGYLAEFSATAENYYSRLIRDLGNFRRNTVFATLNYDLLIETASAANGLRISYSADMPPRNNIALLKLHGSCNFVLDPERIRLKNLAVDASSAQDAAIADGPPSILTQQQTIEYCQDPTALAPMMSLYAKGKNTLVGRRFIHVLQNEYAESIRRASRIFIVGVRVVADDRHVWQPIAESDAPVFYTGPEPAPFLRWADDQNLKRCYHNGDSFEEAVPRIIRRIKRR